MAATRKLGLGIERTINLIDLIRKCPSIWDSKDVNYYKKDNRLSALKVIAAQVGLTVEDVESQWRSLRSSFGRQLKKIAEMNNCDGGAKKLHRPKWVYFKYLEFLRDTILPRKTSNKKQHIMDSPLECQLEYKGQSELDMSYTMQSFDRVVCNDVYESREPYETDEQHSMSCGGEIIMRPTCSSTSFKEDDDDEALDYGTSRKKRKTTPVMDWEKEDALVNLAASQFCIKKSETASTQYGHWIGAVLDELPPAARLEVIRKINNIIHEAQLNLL